MAHSQAILFAEVGQVPPVDVIKQLIEENQSCHGFAAAVNGQVLVGSIGKTADLDAVVKSFEQLKDVPAIFQFGDYPQNFKSEDVQPWPLVYTEAKNCVLAMFAAGDFSPFDEPESTRSHHWMAMQKYIQPKLKAEYERFDNDLDALIKEMHGPIITRELGGTFQGGPGLIFLAGDGTLLTFSKVDKDKQPWGWVMKDYKYESEVVVTEGTPEKPAEKASILGNLMSMLGGTTPTPPAETPKDKEPPKSDPKPDTAQTALARIMAKPPAGLGNNQKKKWYRNHGYSELPMGWEQGVAVLINVPKGIEQPKSEASKGPIKGLEGLGAAMGQTTSAAPKTDTSTAALGTVPGLAPGVHKVEPKKGDNDNTILEVLPLIPVDEQKKLDELMTKGAIKRYLDDTSKVVDLPQLNTSDMTYPTFCMKAGLKGLEQIFNLPFEAFLELAKDTPHGAALLIMNLKLAYMMELSEHGKLKVPEPAKTSVPLTPSTKVVAAAGGKKNMQLM